VGVAVATSRKQREMIPVYRCTACGKEMSDGAAVHWLYCPSMGGRMVRVEVTEEEDDGWDDETEDDES
jgi:rRNA maturation endonuclease Nob1